MNDKKQPEEKPKKLPNPTAEWRKSVDNDVDRLTKEVSGLRSEMIELVARLESYRDNARRIEGANQAMHREIKCDIKSHLKRISQYEREARVAMDRSAKEPVPLRRTA